MATTIHPSVQQTYTVQKPSIVNRFLSWCEGQQENRLLWLSVALGGHGCVLTPLTILLIVALTGMNLVLFMTALFSMAAALIVNLAAMPTRVTIPVLFASVLVDLAVIATAIGLAA